MAQKVLAFNQLSKFLFVRKSFLRYLRFRNKCSKNSYSILMRYFLTILLLSTLLLSCSDKTERKSGFDVHGIDVSHYQSYINWDSVADQDIQFSFMKATEGETMNDTLFCHNWQEARRVGIKRGAYHFFRPTVDPFKQVENFVNWVEMDYGDLPPVLDVEVDDGVSKVSIINAVKTWLFLVEIKYHVRPILYSNLKFYHKYLAGHFDDYPIWIARYSFWEPNIYSEKSWTFWQYGNRGRVKGIQGDVDLNVFSGSLPELEELCAKPVPIWSQNFVFE